MGSGDRAGMGSGWDGLAADAGVIWAGAEKALSVAEPGGPVDVFLWEHTRRVVRAIPHILKIVGGSGPELDRTALFVAALYHDAGWAMQVREATITRWDVLSRPTTEGQRELGAGLAEEHLAGRLSPACLETVSMAIRGINARTTDLPEAQMLAEADNLDEIGPLALWQMVRQNASKGRCIEACIGTWHSRQEYHFWEVMLKRFRFEPVRRLAEKRLQALDQFIQTVASLSRGDDLMGGIVYPADERLPST